MPKPVLKNKRSNHHRHRDARDTYEDDTPSRRGSRQKSMRIHAEEVEQRRTAKPLVCKNQKQKEYLNQIRTHQVTFGVGVAGTGKSYIALKYAAQEFDAGRIERIIITRPIVEVGSGMGFLPGDVGEKTAPYQVPMLDILGEHFGFSHLENLMRGRQPKIEFAPLEFVRGRTLDNCFILLDECQNATPLQTQTLLTRLGENAKVVLDGDPEQCDLKEPGNNGLADAIRRFKDNPLFGYVEFTEEDIVRSDIVKHVILGYRKKY